MEPVVCETGFKKINLSSSFINKGYLNRNAGLLKLSESEKISLGLRLEITVTYYKALVRNIRKT